MGKTTLMAPITSHSKNLGVFKLLMIAIVSVVSIRNIPIAAQYGFSLIFFYVIAGIGFFLPLLLIVRLLAIRYPHTGGSYWWIQKAFGDRLGFISVWLQWIYNIIWYPTIFAFISEVIASFMAPHLGGNKAFILCCSLVLYWIMTAMNCLGVRTVGWMSAIYATLGTLLPMIIIIGLAIAWLLSGYHSASPLTMATLLPSHHNLLNLTYFVNILFSLIGLDVIAAHGDDVKNPARTYTWGLILAGIIILASLMLSSLAICVVVPSRQINLMGGVMEAFKLFFLAHHWQHGTDFIGLAIVLGSMGIASSWMVGLARSLQVAICSNLIRLPVVLQKLNRFKMPYGVLMGQGIIFTILMSIFLLFPNINNSYWILSSMTAQFALVYYVILFFAAYKLLRSELGKLQQALYFGLPIFISSLGILVGFLPPDTIQGIAHHLSYELVLLVVSCIFLLPLRFILKKSED